MNELSTKALDFHSYYELGEGVCISTLANHSSYSSDDQSRSITSIRYISLPVKAQKDPAEIDQILKIFDHALIMKT